MIRAGDILLTYFLLNIQRGWGKASQDLKLPVVQGIFDQT